ncbi:MAG TPA: S53 family peptidase [Ktedonosporobacter sp.]|nr:S53 family peptidase [Ktedonosporobacter sp.]
MTRLFRQSLLLVMIFSFFTACGSGSTGAVNFKEASSTPTSSSSSPTVPATNAATGRTDIGVNDTCPAYLSSVPSCLTPHALRTAYGVESLIQQGFTGKGQTVIDLVSFGSPTIQQDMAVYDKAVGLPPIDLQIISNPFNLAEYDPRQDKPGWAGETTLDVQIIHAIAPDAKVIVLSSPVAETEGTIGLPEFRQLEQYVIDHKLGNIVSQSWGASEITLEDQAGQQELQKWNTFYQNATTQQGMTYFGSSGDEGATDHADLTTDKLSSVATTSFAADSPWVTSVGGTTMLRQNGTFVESAWSHSGGGFSRFYQTPDYQHLLPASVQSQLNNRRGVPDVSAVADPETGLAMYEDGQWTMAGGTSASAPVWAGLMAIANQMAGHPLGFINPALYKLAASSTYAQDFHDITVGNNTYNDGTVRVTGYPAVSGWDPVTGLGTPNAEKLLPDLIAAMKQA